MTSPGLLRTALEMSRGGSIAGLHLYRVIAPSGEVEALATREGDRIPLDDYLEHLRERGYSERVIAVKLHALPELRRPGAAR